MERKRRNELITVMTVGLTALTTPATSAFAQSKTKEVSPARQVERRDRDSHHEDTRRDRKSDFRTLDGSENHTGDPAMNATDTPLLRVMGADYSDGLSAMSGIDRPSARVVSNAVCDQSELIANPFGTSDFLWQWGQFLDHDIDLTEGTDPPEPAPIPVPAGDPFFDPQGTGAVFIPFNRSIHDHDAEPGDVREQLNEITGWIDASNVYGSDEERAALLRTLDGTGRLRVGPGDLLPDDEATGDNATGGSAQIMFIAGDIRANEQVGLAAMHTLFVREHNRVADELRRANPKASGDEIYERARIWVGALMQAITYREFLPALLGRDALPRYEGYDPDVDARIANAFSTAAYRFGHSALSPTLLRLDANLQEIPEGSLALRDAFFSPDRIRDEGGIEPILRGLSQQAHQRIDPLVIDDVRNFLFGPPGAGGFDLPALNLQRGRDHGLPSYAEARRKYGLSRARSFADVSSDPAVQTRLAEAYGDVASIDLWVGGLAEDPERGSQLGPLFTRIIADQFAALRDGDRYWYERTMSEEEIRAVNDTRLADVIRRNTTIGSELPRDVFRVGGSGGGSERDRDGRRRRR